MSLQEVSELRRSPRQRLGRLATIKLGAGMPPRCVLVTNVSEDGVRLLLNGIEQFAQPILSGKQRFDHLTANQWAIARPRR